ncbi:DUF1173 domain-containing protein [Aquamicrobium terrae]
MRRFRIGERALDEDSAEFRDALLHAYEQRLRPLCMCKEPPVPMYIARLDGQHLVKRMPLSGRDHDPACPSYEPPYELSGLGPLIGNAIQIDASGKADLKLDFTLTKRGPRAAPSIPAEPSESSIHSEVRKLSLRAMLHYLWEAGELTEWRSTWAGKRGWVRVRNSLINAASQMTARGGPLSDILFVPEVFHPDDKDGISARRAAALKGVQTTGSGPRKLMLMVGEVKEFATAREGHKIAIRHLPFALMVEDGAWRRLAARYEAELELWRSNEAFHLIVIATFGISSAGIASVEEIALMVVNEHWIPFETLDELRLLERLSGLKRKSVKGLRFNLTRDQPIVSVTLPEQKPAPIAMFIVPAGASEEYEHALADMIEARPEIKPWVWRVAEGEMPRLP